MEENIIYHGSNVEVANPKIVQNGYYKDFGYGFYCTNLMKQARRWAMTRRSYGRIPRSAFWEIVKVQSPNTPDSFCDRGCIKDYYF